ncbi:MAG TPA: RNA 2',3'-cyclic phosphodiesterase [Candidatus Koribacter sp.]|jgi:2'-5' RNA ligase
MRLFFALDIAPEIRRALTSYVDSLRRVPGIRFMPSESYHVTLKFLGEVQDPDRAKHAAEIVRAESFKISFRETGFFPNPKSPRVYWAGIHADDRLPQLAAALDESLSHAGFSKEERPFRPHLTLARSGSGSPTPRRDEQPVAGFRALVYLVEKNPPPDFGTMTASEFFLYESKLSPRGAQYTKVARFPLL